jgi:hypothetical protein
MENDKVILHKDGAIAVQGLATPNRAPPGRWPEVGYRMLAEQG